MRITLFYKIVFVAVIMLLLSFLFPVWAVPQTDLILLPATFLFGTIYSFEIFIVLGNFSELQKLLAKETANLVYIFHMAKSIGGDFAKKLEENIESYILTSIDYSLSTHISSTNQDFLSLSKPIETLEIKGEKHKAALEAINKGFKDIVESRYQLSQVAPREVGASEWIMLVLLAGVLIVTLFLGRQADGVSRVSAAIFATTVIGTLFLLDEADSNHIQETRFEYEIFNQVLEDIGKTSYYPKFAIDKKLVRLNKHHVYRIGKFPLYPNLTKREITLVEK